MALTYKTINGHAPTFTPPTDNRTSTRITIARGDGVGPEIMEATLKILRAAGAPLEYDEVELGEQVYRAGHSAGIAPSDWDKIRRNKMALPARGN